MDARDTIFAVGAIAFVLFVVGLATGGSFRRAPPREPEPAMAEKSALS